MYGSMRRGTLISALLHLFILLALIVTFPHNVPQEPQDEVDVEVIGAADAPPQMSTFTGKTPAANKGPAHHVPAQSNNTPKPKLIVTPPPPPPPPPPSQSVQAPPVPAVKPPPPPPLPTTAVSSAPPVPKIPPQKPQKVTRVEPPKPAPPTHEKATTVQPPSVTHQSHDVKAPVARSKATKNQLLNINAIAAQVQPKAVYNPDQQTDTDPGGTTQSTAMSGLSGADKDAIGAHVRPCFNVDSGAPGVASFHVLLDITTDAGGTIREATVDSQDQGNLSDPLFNAYAQDAIAAALNYQCATLPLPQNMLGSTQHFQFEFYGQ